VVHGVLLRELAVLYEAFAVADPLAVELPELPVQYADYASWQREWLQGDVLEEQISFWRAHLAGAPAGWSWPPIGLAPLCKHSGEPGFTLNCLMS